MLLAPVPGLVLAAYYERSAHLVASAGFPLDDAWIHAQFARNLATGHGFSYTGDRWVAGSTAPLWTFALALGYLLIPNIVIVAKTLGLLCQAATGIAAARLGNWLSESRLIGFTSGLLAAATPILVWGGVSGMEVPLAAGLVLLGIDQHLRAKSATGVLWLALACLARPECLTILALAIADLIWKWLRHREAIHMRQLLQALGVAALILGPWIAFNYATIGKPLPTTFYAKSGSGLVRAWEQRDAVMAQRDVLVFGPQAVINFAIILGDQLGLVAWLIPIGLIACAAMRPRRHAAIFLFLLLVIVPFTMGLTAPQRLKLSNERYVPQLIAIGAVLAGAGLLPVMRALAAAIASVPARAAATAALPVLLVWPVASRTLDGTFWFVRSVKNIQELHVALGEWIRWHIPPGATVATNDVGAIAYFGRHPILDIEGLVSPEALAYRGTGRGLRVVEAFHPDYLVIFPHWYPEIAAQPERFRLVYRASIPDNYISAGGEFLVLQSPWARVPLLTPAQSRDDRRQDQGEDRREDARLDDAGDRDAHHDDGRHDPQRALDE